MYTVKSWYYKHHSQKSIMPYEYIFTEKNNTVAEFGSNFQKTCPQFTFKWKTADIVFLQNILPLHIF